MKDLKALRKFVLPFGIYAGLVRMIIDYIPKKIFLDPEAYYMSFLVSFVFEAVYIPYVMLQYRKETLGITRRESIRIGIIIMLIIGLLYNIGDSFYLSVIDPEFKINTMLRFMEQYSPEILPLIKQDLQASQNFAPSAWKVVSSLSLFALTGIIISFIASFFIVQKSDERSA